MKKVFIAFGLCVLSMLAVQTTNAQITIGAHGGLALPLGTLADVDGIGFGGGVLGKYAITESLNAGARLGFLTFSEGDFPGSGRIISYTSLIDYVFLEEGFRPYVAAEVGFYNFSTDVDLGPLGSVTASTTEFGFAPKLGFLYGLSDILDLDVNAGYNIVSNANHIALNFGVNYRLGG